MTVMSEELLEALEEDESGDLDAIIEHRRPEDFDALRSLLTLDPTVEPSHRAKAIYALGRWGSRRRRSNPGSSPGSGSGRTHQGNRHPWPPGRRKSPRRHPRVRRRRIGAGAKVRHPGARQDQHAPGPGRAEHARANRSVGLHSVAGLEAAVAGVGFRDPAQSAGR